MAAKSILIVGGGFAGLAAAVELSSRGHQVTLLERRGHLGGRAYSYREPVTGSTLDNGQHILMGCYTDTLAFLEKIGTRDRLQEQKNLRVDFKAPGAAMKSLKLAPLPNPWHLLVGLLRFKGLSFFNRIKALRLGKALKALSEEDWQKLDKISVPEWLNRLGQPAEVQAKLWDLITLAALNDQPGVCSAQLLARVLQEALLSGRKSATILLPKVGLSDLYTEAAANFIASHGGHIFLKTPVVRINFHGREFKEVELEGGRKLEADILLLTVPFTVLRKLIPESVLYQDPFFHPLRSLQVSPILSVHFWFDREIVDRDFVGLWGTKIHWLFNKRRLFQGEKAGYVSLVISGARDELAIPGPQLIERSLQELKELFPEARAAKLLHAMVTKEPEATLSPRVGVSQLRLSQKTPYPNLFLAGDWTDTGLPATIESAVRSAKKAVELILGVA